jgi:hypothetical protein
MLPVLIALLNFWIGPHVFAWGWPLTMIHLPMPPLYLGLQLWFTTPSLFIEIGSC